MRTTVVIIGAGHAGLAMSRRLTDRSIDHVVLERGEVASSWRNERWASMRLLTPNWQTTLPELSYLGEDPDGYMTAAEVASVIGGYASRIDAPVRTSTTVERVHAVGDGYAVQTVRGAWRCDAVVIASGPCNVASVPACAAGLPPSITVHTPMTYRTPGQLDDGGVLVVGASATGVQLAQEIHRSGRPVTLAVGEHVRLPRTYRGRDIFWWMDAAGKLDQRWDEVDDIVRARHVPSPQLIGTPERRSIDIATLARDGVTITGRLGRVNDGVAQFSGALANTCALADLKLNRLLDSFDEWALDARIDVGPPERFAPTDVGRAPLQIDLARAGITTALFATGYRPDHSWIDLPVFDGRGRIIHDGGVVTGAPGCFVLGLPVLRRRRSSYINGAAADSADLACALHRHLDERTRA